MKELVLTTSKKPVIPQPGIYYGVPFREYSAWNCFSKSMVSHALKSGAHLDYYIHGPRTETTSIAMGSLADCLILEPELFDKMYVARPDTYTNDKGEVKKWNANAKACKTVLAEFGESGRTVISNADYAKALDLRDAVLAHPVAGPAISAGKKQVSLVWDDTETGVRCKGRLDLDCDSIIYDLKTTRDASMEAFSRDIGNLGYHVQAGAYLQGLTNLGKSPDEFRFIAVETSGETKIPGCIVYRISPESALAGLYQFQRALAKVAHWQKNGVDGYSREITDISALRWVVQRELRIREDAQ